MGTSPVLREITSEIMEDMGLTWGIFFLVITMPLKMLPAIMQVGISMHQLTAELLIICLLLVIMPTMDSKHKEVVS